MRRSLVVSACLSLSVTASAQQRTDTTLRSTTIEVIQSYKPELKQAPKPEFRPDMPPRDTTRPGFRYEVPQQALYYTYSSLPLRPLALGKDSVTLPYPGYLKLGGGTQSTLYLDAGIANFSGDNYETAVHLHHLSQEGNMKNQKVSLSGLEAEGTLRTNDHAIRLSLEGLRNQYYYYGYNQNIYEWQADSVKQTFTGVQVAADLRNERPNRYGLDYHPRIGVYYYGDNRETREQSFFFDLPVKRQLDSNITVGIGVNGNITQLKHPLASISNNIFQITPHADFRLGQISARAGIYPSFGNNGSSYLLPDIRIRYQDVSGKLSFTAGWESRLRQNTYRQLSGENPFIFNRYETLQTKTDEVYAMAGTSISNHFSISGKISWWQFHNLPMFLNDSADRKNFYILYDGLVNAISFQAAIRYNVTDKWSAGVSGQFTSFYKKTYNRVWHEPGVRIRADLSVKALPALTITGYATILEQIYALNELHQEIKLDGVFDIGAGAEYQFIPRLSAFLNVHNLLNDRYQRWYGYNTIGINIFGGLRLKI